MHKLLIKLHFPAGKWEVEENISIKIKEYKILASSRQKQTKCVRPKDTRVGKGMSLVVNFWQGM